MKTRKFLGKRGEDLAVHHLKKLGYEIVETNFRFDRAEIDVVARDEDILVFVEV
ncbi:MAG: YraN family protein, partial [Bacteroidota bacterium]